MSLARTCVIRWALIFLSLLLVVFGWLFEPRGGWALLLFAGLVVTGIPAAMLSLIGRRQ